MTITVTRNYNGEDYIVHAPDWLQEKIDLTTPYLNPLQKAHRLVCHDNPRALLTYGQTVPSNGGYKIDIVMF